MSLESWLQHLRSIPLVTRRAAHPCGRARRRPPHVRLGVEALEDRWVPSNAGVLDPTFGNNGVVSTDVPGSRSDYARDLVVNLPGGKILVAGSSYGGTGDLVLARYNADGSPDTTFGSGTGRVVETNVGGANALAADAAGDAYVVSYNRLAYYSAAGVKQWDTYTNLAYAADVAVDASGRAVVAGYRYGYNPATGYYSSDFGVVRYNPDGTLDPTAFAPADFGAGTYSDDYAQSVAVDSQGRVVVAGYNYSDREHAAVARYLSDGTLDPSFDGDGLATIDFARGNSYQYNYALAVAVDAADNVIVGGYGYGESYSPNYDYTYGGGVARLRADTGAADTSFGTGGKVLDQYTRAINSLAVDGAGRIMASQGYQLIRYTGTGGRDQGFGYNGAVYNTSVSYVYAVAIQSDGKIVAAGYRSNGTSGDDFTLARFDGTTGNPDTGFGVNGAVSVDIVGSRSDSARDLVVNLPGGKILVAGYSQAATTDLVLARYNADGTPDTTFGGGTGRVVESNGVSSYDVRGLAADAAGNAYVIANNQLAYYSADGTRQWRMYISGFTYAADVAVDSSGRAVVVGERSAYNPATGYYTYDFAVARYNADGTLDPTAFAPADSGAADYSSARSVAVDSHGRVVVAGYASGHGVVARYLSDGTLDTSFDGDGLATVDFARGYDYTSSDPRAVTVDAADNVVVGGYGSGQSYSPDYSTYSYTYGGGLERLRADTGAPDASFDGDGSLIDPYTDTMVSLAVDAAGRVVATRPYSNQIWRYTSGGERDLSFGGTGLVWTPIYDIRGVAVQADGNVVAAGTYSSSTTGPDIGLVRYTGTDDSPPAVSVPDLDAGSDTGASASDKVTRAAALTFSGTAEGGSTLRLWEGNTLLGTVNVPGYWNYGSYSWSLSVSGLSEGAHTVYATATDFAGNTATSGTLTVLIDRTAPAISASATTADNNAYTPGVWTNQDVTVHFTTGDSLSGIATSPHDATVTTERAGQAVSGTVFDNAGNSASATFADIRIDKTDPVTTADQHGYHGEWVNHAVTITLGADDQSGLSGVRATYYALDGGPAQAYDSTAGIVVSDPGVHTVAYWSVDNAGNEETHHTLAVRIDRAAPTTSAASDGQAYADAHFGWNNTDVTVTLNAGDTGGSGLSTTQYSLDNGANWTPYGGPFTLSSEGTHTVLYRSTDVAGNVESSHTLTVNIDKTNPTLTGTLSAPPVGGWYNVSTGALTITFQASDALSGGVTAPAAHTFSDAANQSYSVTVTDLAGNSSTYAITGVNQDTVAPTISSAIHGANGDATFGGWWNIATGAPTVRFGTTDPLATVSGPTTLGEGAGQSVTGTATDQAGNSTSLTVSGVNVDLTAPTISASPDRPPNAAGWYNADVTVSYAVADTLSGVDTAAGGYGADVLAASGTASGTVYDRAGNSASASYSAQIDKVKPVTTASLPPVNGNNGYYVGAVTVTLSAEDATSGVAVTKYRVDGGPLQTYGAPFTVTAGGVHTVTFYSVDKAGNQEADRSTSFKIDTAPAAAEDAYSVGQDHTLTVAAASGVKSNDTDADGDALAAILVTGPTHGKLTFNADGSFTYTPNSGFYGTDTFTYKVNDGNLDSNVATAFLTVSQASAASVYLTPDTEYAGTNALVVNGTSGNDTISIKVASGGGVEVVVNGVSRGVYNPTGRIIVFGYAGDDNVQVDGAVPNECWLYGDDGADTLNLGNGGGIAVGGSGNDTLTGGSGRDILIGGAGSDRIVGNPGEDILISAITSYDDRFAKAVNEDALFSIFKEWKRTDLAYIDRVHHLEGTTAVGGTTSGTRGGYNDVAGGFWLNDSTIADDSGAVDQIDILTGSSGEDWYVYGKGDKLTGMDTTESQNALKIT
jgi:uncharacterized delta-60 repeat protein